MKTKDPNAPKDLADAITRLAKRNNDLAAYLGTGESAIERVANAPEVGLDEATERARKHWDAIEGRRSSVPPGGAK